MDDDGEELGEGFAEFEPDDGPVGVVVVEFGVGVGRAQFLEFVGYVVVGVFDVGVFVDG